MEIEKQHVVICLSIFCLLSFLQVNESIEKVTSTYIIQLATHYTEIPLQIEKLEVTFSKKLDELTSTMQNQQVCVSEGALTHSSNAPVYAT